MSLFVTTLLVKVTLLLAFALVVVALMRGFAPAHRHVVLLASLAAALALPALMLLTPEWRIALLPPAAPAPAQPVAVDAAALPSLASPAKDGAAPPGAIGRRGQVFSESSGFLASSGDLTFLPLAWLAGLAAVIAWLLIGRTRLEHIARMSWPLTDSDWTSVLDDERRAASIERPVRLLSSPTVSTPLTWGWRAPVVLLPEDASDWPEAHRRIVLRHELAHVARADSLAQLVAGLACGLYWFHPLVWLVERRLRAECERACDDTVVSSGTPAAEYAAHLLEVARSARSFGASGFLSVAMARPSQLEGRLLAVLNESRRRVSVSSGARLVAACGAALIVLPLAAFRPVPRETPIGSAKFSSTVAKAGSNTPTRPVGATNQSALPMVTQAAADTTFQLTAPASAGGTLVLDLRTGGRVVIESWDRPQVQVRASLAGSAWRRTRVSLTPTGDGVRLESFDSGNGETQTSRHVFEITVPRRFDIRLSSAGGSVSINGVSGSFTGNTGGGEIQIRDAHGKADLHTGGGDVRVSNSSLDGVVSTGGGTVRIEGVTGNLSGFSGGGPVVVNKRGAVSVTNAGGANIVSVNTRDDGVHEGSGSGAGSGSSFSTSSSGTGSIYAESSGSGPIHVTSAGGALSLPAAPEGARVVTGGGAIRIGPSGGQLYVSTGGGSIDVGPARGSVVANTGAGNVSVELEGAGGHSVDIFSGSGHVALVVPADLDAVLDLESAYTNNLGHQTRIVSEIPVNVTETTDWDDSHGTPRRYVRARQTVGRGGPVIKVRTVNGDIQISTRG